MAIKDTDVIINKLYPVVEKALSSRSGRFLKNIQSFINSRHEEIFAIAPYDRIYFNANDKSNLYNAIGLKEKNIENIVKECFFWGMDYTPNAAKEPYVEMIMCCIIYYINKKQIKNAEITTIYLAFTGKFYVSLHCYFWEKFPPDRTVMDFVINTMLSDKFDIKKEGSVFGAIRKLCSTWVDTYKDNLTDPDITDDEMGKLIQQLRDREKSFLKNIANLYYEAYNNKSYLNYETDNLDADEFRITDNDAATAARITESTVNKITSQSVNLKICDQCKNVNVTALEIKQIIEGVLRDKGNIPKLRRSINIIICDFMSCNPKSRVGSNELIAHTMKSKPNTKSKILIELKGIICDWIEENSIRFKTSKRQATRNNFYRSILMYLTLMICSVCNEG
jgi:hypothetical protein